MILLKGLNSTLGPFHNRLARECAGRVAHQLSLVLRILLVCRPPQRLVDEKFRYFHSSMQPITERSNDLTRNLDVVGPRGIVRLLRQCDTQIFAGWEEWDGLCDETTLQTLENLANSIQPHLRHTSASSPAKNVKFIMSGAGTSGRLAFYCARTLNKVRKMDLSCCILKHDPYPLLK
jgi:hypothetical protein